MYYRFDEKNSKKVYKNMHMSKDFKIVELKLEDYRNSIISCQMLFSNHDS